jgi:hypothetical protein
LTNVFVNVQTIVSLVPATGTLFCAPGVTVGSEPSWMPLPAVPPPAPLSLKQDRLGV